MPPRSSWKGFLKLSLVSVPVKGYTANASSADIRMNQLHAECNNRIKYKKVCPEHGEVSNDEIVSGYEFSKGQYVVIDLDELDKLRRESDKSINIDGFIRADQVDPVYYNGRHQYLVPDGPVGQKPYALLHEAMVEKGLFAIGQVVMSGREQLVVVRPLEGMLAVTVLNWEQKVKKPESFEDEIQRPELSKQEIALTHTLVEASTIEDFDFSVYKDTYTDKLTELIQAKVDGKEIVAVHEPDAPQIINLMDALKESVAKAQAAAGAGGEKKKAAADKKTTAKSGAKTKMAPSAGKTAKATRKKSG